MVRNTLAIIEVGRLGLEAVQKVPMEFAQIGVFIVIKIESPNWTGPGIK